jgi:hypothetical protein
MITATEFALQNVADHGEAGTSSGLPVLAFGVVTAGTDDFRRIGSFDSHSVYLDAAARMGVAAGTTAGVSCTA